MAAVALNDSFKIEAHHIEMGRFIIPFHTVSSFRVFEGQRGVRVWFTGAMGLTEQVVVEFRLQTAQKVDEFVREFGRREISNSVLDDKPLYTISSDQAWKEGQLLTGITEEDALSWITTISVHSEMAEAHPRLVPLFAPLFTHYDEGRDLQNPVKLEILKNIFHHRIREIRFHPSELESLVQIGREKQGVG